MKIKNITILVCAAAVLITAYIFNNPFHANHAKADLKGVIDGGKSKKAAAKDLARGYRLSVSFYSIGEGIDRGTNERFMNYVESYNPSVSFEKNPWGREGETDYCFRLSELNKRQQDAFVSGAKKILGRSEMVNVYENRMCPH